MLGEKIMQTKRFQLDLTEQEHAEMERLANLAGIKTKREFVSNALTLFRWAAAELANGRAIGSFDAAGKLHKQLEMPALTALAACGAAAERLNRRMPTSEQLDERTQEPSVPMAEVLAELSKRLGEIQDAQSRVPAQRSRATA